MKNKDSDEYILHTYGTENKKDKFKKFISMINHSHFRKQVKDGMISAIPIMFGYFPVAVAFGLLAKTVGITFTDSVLFSILVFAGASQFMALDLIKAGLLMGDIILATFLLNLRHMMMSASLSQRITEKRKAMLLFIAFGVTDETFAVSSVKEEGLTTTFLLTLHGLAYIAWVSGTATGYLVGAILPATIQSSLGIGLYAMFAAILTPEVKKSSKVLILALIAAAVYLLIDFTHILPDGWYLVATILISSIVGAAIFKDEGVSE